MDEGWDPEAQTWSEGQGTGHEYQSLWGQDDWYQDEWYGWDANQDQSQQEQPEKEPRALTALEWQDEQESMIPDKTRMSAARKWIANLNVEMAKAADIRKAERMKDKPECFVIHSEAEWSGASLRTTTTTGQPVWKSSCLKRRAKVRGRSWLPRKGWLEKLPRKRWLGPSRAGSWSPLGAAAARPGDRLPGRLGESHPRQRPRIFYVST